MIITSKEGEPKTSRPHPHKSSGRTTDNFCDVVEKILVRTTEMKLLHCFWAIVVRWKIILSRFT